MQRKDHAVLRDETLRRCATQLGFTMRVAPLLREDFGIHWDELATGSITQYIRPFYSIYTNSLEPFTSTRG